MARRPKMLLQDPSGQERAPEENEVVDPDEAQAALAAAALMTLSGPCATQEECAHCIIVAVNVREGVCLLCRKRMPATGHGVTVRVPEEGH